MSGAVKGLGLRGFLNRSPSCGPCPLRRGQAEGSPVDNAAFVLEVIWPGLPGFGERNVVVGQFGVCHIQMMTTCRTLIRESDQEHR